MLWKKFDRLYIPQNETFLLTMGEDIFFAKVFDGKIVTKCAYADVERLTPADIVKRGKDLNYFEQNAKFCNAKPLWERLFTPWGN